ncbi:hypothetical protein HW555_004728 [Spodoptera exigua]|uniref:Uncharacterized protein n=1 Tax=Spodoptera exigua TaxID=7107 RepID=A0A835GLU8_SPOEX|nr:hypothetical protein HW555_004728 [Spodoptera exigua]
MNRPWVESLAPAWDVGNGSQVAAVTRRHLNRPCRCGPTPAIESLDKQLVITIYARYTVTSLCHCAVRTAVGKALFAWASGARAQTNGDTALKIELGLGLRADTGGAARPVPATPVPRTKPHDPPPPSC